MFCRHRSHKIQYANLKKHSTKATLVRISIPCLVNMMGMWNIRLTDQLLVLETPFSFVCLVSPNVWLMIYSLDSSGLAQG